ncbi:hypothetical protein [Companilactobacillus farciminis]|uniref:hypothetical protein n=1 Tax=Companilactobacillus farciminis TaxID=1612 RepID=UPI002330CD3A|nr:hypothetical protein [Companilactobacillus farciminis]WCG36396.1 hypothetical protein PML84_04290 [Companilactobacillus farciminis]
MNKSRIMEPAQELASVPDNDTGYAKHYILEDIENELNEKLEDKNMRILKSYSKAEQRELEEAKDNGFLSVIALFCSIKHDDNNCHALYEKYYREDTNGNNQMAKDIIDFYFGDAKFPEQKYYVQLIKGNENSYLTIDPDGILGLGRRLKIGSWKTKFTRDEVVAIDPRLVPFMEEVEE